MVLPALTAIVLGVALKPIGEATWQRIGYVMAPQTFDNVQLALFAAGAATLAACALIARAAYRKADDFAQAAARVDDAVSARQEIITLASLTGPHEAEGVGAEKTTLFPVLWRRATGYLELFDPDSTFAMEIRRPLLRSVPLAAGIVVLLAAAAFALVRPPSAAEMEAHKLREIAHQMAKSPNPAQRSLGAKVRSVASALENPKLPPEEKIARLDELMRQLKQPEHSSTSQSPKHGNGKGKGNGNGSGQGKGRGNGHGQGKGQGQGNGAGAGEKPNGPKSNRQIAELKNDISKAKEQIETGSAARKKSPQPGKSHKGNALKPGNNPNKKGPSKKPNGSGEAEVPKPQVSAKSHIPSSGKSGKHSKGGTGNTHLGEFPAPAKFKRFTPGKGPPIEIRDARFVLFRLPTDVISNGGAGKLVRDTSRPAVTAPYVNVPLKKERLDVAPQERQLVPPRYRDLIR